MWRYLAILSWLFRARWNKNCLSPAWLVLLGGTHKPDRRLPRVRAFLDSFVTTVSDSWPNHACIRPHFSWRLDPFVQPMGRSRHSLDPRASGFSRRGQPESFRTVGRTAKAAALARSAQSPGIRRAHHAAHSDCDGAVAHFHLHLCDACREKPIRRTAPGAAARHSAIGADSRLHLGHCRIFHESRARARARRRIRL